MSYESGFKKKNLFVINCRAVNFDRLLDSMLAFIKKGYNTNIYCKYITKVLQKNMCVKFT